MKNGAFWYIAFVSGAPAEKSKAGPRKSRCVGWRKFWLKSYDAWARPLAVKESQAGRCLGCMAAVFSKYVIVALFKYRMPAPG